MKKGRSAPQVSHDKKGFFDGLYFVSRKENVIQEETEPMHHCPQGPDQIEKEQKFESFRAEFCGRVLGGEKRAVECSPEETKVVLHLSYLSLSSCIEKAHVGFLCFYSISNSYTELAEMIELVITKDFINCSFDLR
jgi:hypothetical protein